ncbi:hyoscyamine 6-dioxygenase-like [Trifolium pratense]|uniref:hyoscyamine 6-dioxygenase-like n=1 Tax=Trifolium pratense TaxID=57577 RepID=UPI001E695D58|nr:hyoscyamine 6-dioxygenase-like [Trifolium pratense]
MVGDNGKIDLKNTLNIGESKIFECRESKSEFIIEIVGKYTQELRALGLRILDLISEGLGLGPNYFSGELSENPVVISHHYPPCPEPSLTLGASKHKDPNILTILFQERNITALHVLKDGAWIPVEPIPNAFVVNMGRGLCFRLIGAEHRVITNASPSRHTIAYFINPSKKPLYYRTC